LNFINKFIFTNDLNHCMKIVKKKKSSQYWD
jgi:hypothetical protein